MNIQDTRNVTSKFNYSLLINKHDTMKKIFLLTIILYMTASMPISGQTSSHKVWSIGTLNNSSSEFALGPNNFRQFLANDFGYEDKFYLIGHSDIKKDFPYVLPGPADTWGGTWPTSGWRTHQANILFGLDNVPANGEWKLVINLLDYAKTFLPLVKVSINA